MTPSELSYPVKVRAIKDDPYVIKANQEQLRALAVRFGLPKIAALRAQLLLTPKGSDIVVNGPISAEWLQICAVAGDEFPVTMSEEIHLRFVPSQARLADEEIELEAEDCDEIEFDGDSFDLGEAVAQTLGLAIDPYATGPNAAAARTEKGITLEGRQDGPMAELLAALKNN